MHLAVRRDADEVLVEGTVVDRAEAQTVADQRLALLVGVGDDVRRVEQPDLLERADGAAVAVCGKNGAPELRLVDALLDEPHDVAALDRVADVDGAALLGFAASLPDVRGSGAGLALTEAAFAWAHEQGYASMVTDWRETNLLSSRFWPARGFRSFVRLYRSIP